MADGNSFWYVEGAPDNTVIWKVDPVGNTKLPLFDSERLRKVLTPLLEHEPPHRGLPFHTFTFEGDGEKTVKFAVEDKEFILGLDTYTITRVYADDIRVASRKYPIRAPKSPVFPKPAARWHRFGQQLKDLRRFALVTAKFPEGNCRHRGLRICMGRTKARNVAHVAR